MVLVAAAAGEAGTFGPARLSRRLLVRPVGVAAGPLQGRFRGPGLPAPLRRSSQLLGGSWLRQRLARVPWAPGGEQQPHSWPQPSLRGPLSLPVQPCGSDLRCRTHPGVSCWGLPDCCPPVGLIGGTQGTHLPIHPPSSTPAGCPGRTCGPAPATACWGSSHCCTWRCLWGCSCTASGRDSTPGRSGGCTATCPTGEPRAEPRRGPALRGRVHGD